MRQCSECGGDIGPDRKANAKTCGAPCGVARSVRRKCERDSENCQPRPRPPPLVKANNESDNGFSQAELLARKARNAERLKAAKPLNTNPCALPDDSPAMLPKDADPDWNGFPPGPRRRRLMKLFAEAGYGD